MPFLARPADLYRSQIRDWLAVKPGAVCSQISSLPMSLRLDSSLRVQYHLLSAYVRFQVLVLVLVLGADKSTRGLPTAAHCVVLWFLSPRGSLFQMAT